MALNGNNKVSTSARSSGPTSQDSMPKEIVRTSKPTWNSGRSLMHDETLEDGERSIPPDDSGRSNVRQILNNTSGSSSLSSSESDEDVPSAHVSRTKSSKILGVKVEPNDPNSLLTLAASIGRAFSSPKQGTFNRLERLDDRLKAKGFQADEIDNTLVKLKDEGKPFKEICHYFERLTGVVVHMSTWVRRYNRIRAREETLIEKNVGCLKTAGILKRSRKISSSYDTDEDSDDETVDADFRKPPPKRTLRASQRARQSNIPEAAANTTEHDTPPQRARTFYQRGPPRSLPTSIEEASEADSALLHMKGVENFMKSSTSCLPILELHKLNRTTLRISHSGSFTPLKLRSCKTMTDLFNAVTSICDLDQASHGKGGDTVKAIFSWIPENDSSRTILLKEKFEDSFEVFLETINEAPCWETENSKCTVYVEVLHRNICRQPAGEALVAS